MAPIPYPHRRNPLEARVSKVPDTPDPMARANNMTVIRQLYVHSYIVASELTAPRPDLRTLSASTKERRLQQPGRDPRIRVRRSPRNLAPPASRGCSPPVEEPLDVHARVERGIRIAGSGLLDYERNCQGSEEARDSPPHRFRLEFADLVIALEQLPDLSVEATGRFYRGLKVRNVGDFRHDDARERTERLQATAIHIRKANQVRLEVSGEFCGRPHRLFEPVTDGGAQQLSFCAEPSEQGHFIDTGGRRDRPGCRPADSGAGQYPQRGFEDPRGSLIQVVNAGGMSVDWLSHSSDCTIAKACVQAHTCVWS